MFKWLGVISPPGSEMSMIEQKQLSEVFYEKGVLKNFGLQLYLKKDSGIGIFLWILLQV